MFFVIRSLIMAFVLAIFLSKIGRFLFLVFIVIVLLALYQNGLIFNEER